jgi:hypothetical protein
MDRKDTIGYSIYKVPQYSILDPRILFSVYGIAHLHRSTQSIYDDYIYYLLRYLGAIFKVPGLNISWSMA